MLLNIEASSHQTRLWLAQFAIATPICLGLSILNAVLLTVGDQLGGDSWRIYDRNAKGGQPPES